MGVVRLVVKGAKEGVKYAPAITAVVSQARGPATEYARSRLEAARQQRLAVVKAASLTDGSMLEVLHGETPVWVVFSGDEPVSAHPEVGVPLADLLKYADLDLRRRPGDFPTARERASAMRRRAVLTVRRKKSPDAVASSVVDPDAELVGEGARKVEQLEPADDRALEAGQA